MQNSLSKQYLEKEIRRNYATDPQRTLVSYLKILRDYKFNNLVNCVDPTIQAMTVGELKMIQRLLSIMELSAEPMDFSADNSNKGVDTHLAVAQPL